MKVCCVEDTFYCRKVMAAVNPPGITVYIDYPDYFSGDLHTPEELAGHPDGRPGNDAIRFPCKILKLDQLNL